jgi:hypothetical protein
MGNKSRVAEQRISVPIGDGAMKGSGETFSPDLLTGTEKFTIPITFPPGRNDFRHIINFVFSTWNGHCRAKSHRSGSYRS